MAILEKINSPRDLKQLKTEELTVLAAEIRRFLIDSISETGGHLASNLGIVELTLAIHKVFDSPNDSIVWDVGHQSYVHKILTGRKDRFPTLRKFGGLSGFPKTAESVHDTFNSGHSSDSISVALGIAEANRLKNNKNFAVAVLGDGALTGGLAYEALNNAGRSKANLIVILNDNEMSISHNVGSMTNYLNKLRTDVKYTNLKERVKSRLSLTPAGSRLSKVLNNTKYGIKHLFLPGTLFEALGFTYIGPIDGHDTSMLLSVLESAKHLEKPVFIHVYTKKGKGYTFAENAPDLYHGTGAFDKTKPIVPSEKQTFSKVSGDEILNLAKTDSKIVAVSAAMADSTGLKPFSETFPKRFFDVGISEAHAVTFSAGLAESGFFPIICIYSTFMQRAYDSIVHDLALQQNLSAVLCLDRAGLVGEDGETHHGIFDIAYLSHIPNVKVFTPHTAEGVKAALRHAAAEKKGIYAIRYPRGEAENGEEISDIFAPEQLRAGEKVTVVTVSRMTNVLEKTDFNGDHFHLNCIKPIKTAEIIKSLQKTHRLVTAEDNLLTGGMGQLLANALNDAGFDAYKHLPLGIRDRFVPQGSVCELLSYLELDEKHIAEKIEEFIK